MEEKSWAEILELVRTDDSINFFARVATAWSAISVDVLMSLLEMKGVKINAVIGIDTHITLNNLIGPSNFLHKCIHFFLIRRDEREEMREQAYLDDKNSGKSWINYYQTIFRPYNLKNPLYYALFDFNTPPAVLANQFSFMGRDIIVCHFDEGFAMYSGSFYNSYPNLNEVKSLGALRGYIRSTLMGKHFYKLYHQVPSSLIMRETVRGWVTNMEVVPFYREVFKKRNESLHVPIEKETLSKSIVICTIGWRRCELKSDDDLRVQKLVCNALKEKGYHLYLKAHPRDTFTPQYVDELGCEILSAPGLSMEGICEYAQPLAVISFHSATLITPQIFWDIPTFSISEMLDPTQISPRIQKEIVQFKKTFKNFVHFCKSADDVVLALEKRYQQSNM